MQKIKTSGILLTIAGVVTAAYAGLAQAPGSGRPVRTPVTLHPHDLEASYIRMPLPPGQEAYGRLEGNHIKQFMQEIVAVSRKSKEDGELLWGRVAGTKYDDMVEGIVENTFKQFGLQDVHRQYFDLGPQWFPTAWELAATGGGKTVRLASARAASGSPATPAGGLDLEPLEAVARAYAKIIDEANKLALADLGPAPVRSSSGR